MSWIQSGGVTMRFRFSFVLPFIFLFLLALAFATGSGGLLMVLIAPVGLILLAVEVALSLPPSESLILPVGLEVIVLFVIGAIIDFCIARFRARQVP